MGDGEPAQAYAHKLRTAKKEHKCVECHGIIKAGEQYHYHSGVWDGEGRSFAECLDCAEIRKDIDAGSDEPTSFEGLSDAVEGYRGEYVGRMLATMRKRGARIPQWMVEFVEAQAAKRMTTCN